MNQHTAELIDEYVKANLKREWDRAHKLFLKIKEAQDAELASIIAFKNSVLNS